MRDSASRIPRAHLYPSDSPSPRRWPSSRSPRPFGSSSPRPAADLVAPGWPFGDPAPALLASAALAIGALLGDLWGAFVKRRLHRPRGAKTTGLDQYDFVIGALAAPA